MQQNLIEFGPHQFSGNYCDLTPVEVAETIGGIPTDEDSIMCFVNGAPTFFESGSVLGSGSTVVFIRRFGRKGAIQNDLDRIAGSLGEIANQLERLSSSLTDSVEYQRRLADQFAPNSKTVGTSYVAGRLGTSTRWIGDLVRGGEIPSDCIVPKSGNGKYWKFHKHKIDQWIEGK